MKRAATSYLPKLMRGFGGIATVWIVLVSLGFEVTRAQDGVPAKAGDDLEVKFKGKKKRAKVKKILIRLKFFTAKGPRQPKAARMEFKNLERDNWIRQAKWWVKRINKNCDIRRIAGVKNAGRDRTTIPKLTTNFMEDLSLRTSSDPDMSRFLVGDAQLARRIGANTSTRFFNIGIFKTVRTASQFADSAGTVPGKFIAPNVMAADQSMQQDDRRHELGHLMGLKHSDGGMMHKNNPKKGASTKNSPWYGDEHGGKDDFLKSWCPKIAAHLRLQK